MKTKRRDFLKLTGVAGLSWVGKGAVGHAAEWPMADQTDLVQLNRKYQASHKQRVQHGRLCRAEDKHGARRDYWDGQPRAGSHGHF